ncbi:MAG TPA: OsmC family protein [Vicinamibacteria bacterium]|nr:OsmC family protein [Vicinamibacteria bacterium]
MTSSDAPRPPLQLSITWERDLLFSGSIGEHRLLLDGDGQAGVSPVQALGFALASCMGSDVALILTRGRHPLRALRARLTAHRAPTDPRRFVSVTLRFEVEGAVPREAVERALALSRDRYCSVWHSLREDITFETSFEVTA